MNYLINRFDDIVSALAQHTQIVLITLFFSLILASMLTYFSIKNRTVQLLLKAFLAMLFSIPSSAFFGLMIPFTGLGRTSAIIVLVIYQQCILLNNFLDGLMNIEPSIIEAAQGMGMSNHQILFKIQFHSSFK